jgi:recombination associated protein RdgC
LTLRRDRRIPGKSRLARERHIAIKKREAELSKRLTKDEKDAVTEAVKKNLLQFYPPDETIMQAVYASTSRKLYVLESSLPKAKYFVDKIDRALKPQNTSISFSEDSLKPVLDETLTSWVHHSTKLPSEYGFEVGRSMRLESEGNSAVLSGQDSDTAEVREHLHANKRVSSVALTWKDNVDFTLSSKRIISAIDMKKFCGESLKSVKAECQEDIRAYEQGTLLVYISTLEDLCDAVYSIPSELDV